MKKGLKAIWSLGALAMILGVGVSLNAQQAAPPTQQATPPATSSDPSAATPQTQTSDPSAAPATQPTDPTAQQPATTPQAQPSQTPDPATQATPDNQSSTPTATSDTQSFSGTVVKVGDKYVLQDADSGKTYDIDHQDQVKQYEGKKVRVHGTLDASGKMIHVQ
jgi:cytoskeletal protein RodZ